MVVLSRLNMDLMVPLGKCIVTLTIECVDDDRLIPVHQSVVILFSSVR